MKKKFLYSTVLITLISISITIFLVHHIRQKTLLETKIIEHLPNGYQLIINFKNPEEIYHQYLMQNTIFKEINFNKKHTFIHILKDIDSMYSLANSKNIHFKEYSFYIVVYPSSKWIFCFTAYQNKDVKHIHEFLNSYSFIYKEIDGNFFITNQPNFLTTLYTHHQHRSLNEWLNIFSKNPAPLNVYEKKDTTETAYQINFFPDKIYINGMLKYKNTQNNTAYPSINIPCNENYSIQPFILSPNTHDTSEVFNQFYQFLIQSYLQKKISTNHLNILPVHSEEENSHMMMLSVSDSSFQSNDLIIYKIKNKYKNSLYNCLKIYLDSNMYASIYNNNIIWASDYTQIINNKNFIQTDFSKSSYYLNCQKNITPQQVNNQLINSPLALSIQFNQDTSTYNLFAEVFSLINQNYFSYTFQLEKVPRQLNHLWTYQHPLKINKIVGFFNDHKTKSNFTLIQDTAFNLTAINAYGEKLWTYSLSSTIHSKIYTIDALKNNKHQMLFNTSDGIYLLDRNGKNVGSFPILFTSKITNALKVFEFDYAKNYRIWFSAQNHYTYNYTLNAQKADNYKPYFFPESIYEPAYYAPIGLSDYIILISDKGNIIAISRKGEGRLILKNHLPNDMLCYTYDISNALQYSYIYYATSYKLCRISMTDAFHQIITFNDTIISAAFVTHPLSKQKFLITLSKKELTLQSLTANKIESIKLNEPYEKLYVQSSQNNHYYILMKNNLYTIIEHSIDNKLQVLQKNIYSTTLPSIAELFDNNKVYMIYCTNNELICKNIH